VSDLNGRTYGQLTVIKPAGRDSLGRLLLACLCSCGAAATLRADNVRRGNSKSCGHLIRRRA
jgi:hypothetical protein